ncbi:MAG: hypothetical protein JWQ84_170 [Mucilaginibacter sp.]|nr:hypothetical protein [Mucilaginibacter sp.]
MKVENPVAFSFIMQDDLYLLNKEKAAFEVISIPLPVVELAFQPVIETVTVNFNYLGGHKKNILVIVHYSEVEFMPERHLAALESTLKRLEISLDDTAVLNRAAHPEASFDQLTAFFKPQKLLILGNSALPPGLVKIERNRPLQLNNYPALFTFGFDEMMDSNENKKAFWEQMKLW